MNTSESVLNEMEVAVTNLSDSIKKYRALLVKEKIASVSDFPHEANVVVKIYFRRPTAEKKGYISAYTSYPKRDGEDWNRGNDLKDGGWDQETVNLVKRDIDRVFAQQKAEVEAPQVRS
jgi:hypothetical protein